MGGMKVNVRSFKGQRFNVIVNPTDKVHDLLKEVAREAGLDYNEVRLLFESKDLSNNLDSTVG